jgi:hypothetical protein
MVGTTPMIRLADVKSRTTFAKLSRVLKTWTSKILPQKFAAGQFVSHRDSFSNPKQDSLELKPRSNHNRARNEIQPR